jgi:hypothetical protein
MGTRTRRAAGVFLVLFGVASFALFLRVFLFVGLPRVEEGAKGAAYAWVLTLSIPLPLTVGVALLRGLRSWRAFVGWWLLAAGALAVGTLLWFLPAYQGWPLSFVVGTALCGLPPILCGLALLRRAGRQVIKTGQDRPEPPA